jgi:hypothetical protein
MRMLRTMLMLLAVLCIGTTTVGCDKNKSSGKTATVDSGPMPDGADWTGVYYSPLYGHLHLVSSGNLVEGKWQRPRKGQWGKLTGNTEGNVLHFDWVEYVDGLVGPNSKKEGKGYLVYRRPDGENVDDVIEGETGRGEDEVGAPWEAIKQRNVNPDLDAIGGSGAGEVGGGDWDSSNSEDSSDAEDPVEPDAEPPEL